jgi:hypothetical protein
MTVLNKETNDSEHHWGWFIDIESPDIILVCQKKQIVYLSDYDCDCEKIDVKHYVGIKIPKKNMYFLKEKDDEDALFKRHYQYMLMMFTGIVMTSVGVLYTACYLQ